MHRWKVYFCFLFFCVLGSPIFADTVLQTYFTYTPEELKALQESNSDYILSKDELRKWDYIATRAVEDKKLTFFEYTRIFTYLYVAQVAYKVLEATNH